MAYSNHSVIGVLPDGKTEGIYCGMEKDHAEELSQELDRCVKGDTQAIARVMQKTVAGWLQNILDREYKSIISRSE